MRVVAHTRARRCHDLKLVETPRRRTSLTYPATARAAPPQRSQWTTRGTPPAPRRSRLYPESLVSRPPRSMLTEGRRRLNHLARSAHTLTDPGPSARRLLRMNKKRASRVFPHVLRLHLTGPASSASASSRATPSDLVTHLRRVSERAASSPDAGGIMTRSALLVIGLLLGLTELRRWLPNHTARPFARRGRGTTLPAFLQIHHPGSPPRAVPVNSYRQGRALLTTRAPRQRLSRRGRRRTSIGSPVHLKKAIRPRSSRGAPSPVCWRGPPVLVATRRAGLPVRPQEPS